MQLIDRKSHGIFIPPQRHLSVGCILWPSNKQAIGESGLVSSLHSLASTTEEKGRRVWSELQGMASCVLGSAISFSSSLVVLNIVPIIFREEPEYTHNSTILFFKDIQKILTKAHWKSTNNANSTAQPGQHQKAHSDVNDIPPHPPHNPHPAWVEQVHQSHTHWLPLLQPDCARHSTWALHLINWTGLMEGAWEMVNGHAKRGRAHSHSHRAHEQCTAPECQAKPASIN